MCKQLLEGEKAKAFLSLLEEDKTLQKIAEHHFVQGLSYEQTGFLVGYSARQVGRLCKKIKQIASVLDRCDAYCGVACVDGSCPKIENKQYRCVDCWLYKGCKDCCFDGDIDFCPKAKEKTI